METVIVKTEENKVHERTDLSFFIKNATSPVSKGINISKTAIIIIGLPKPLQGRAYEESFISYFKIFIKFKL